MTEYDIVQPVWKHTEVHKRTATELASCSEYKRRDETHHGLVNSELFRDFISENQDIWDDALKYDIYQAIREIVAYEQSLVDYFNPFNSSNADLKRYIEYRADIALNELGMKKNYNTTVNPLGYMDDVVGQIMTDFFAGTVTEYSGNLDGSWDDVDFSRWSNS